MTKLAVIATMKVAPGTRDESVRQLVAHGERCRAGEPGTLVFEVLVPHEQADTILLYEVYENEDAFKAHLSGESIEQVKRDTAGMLVSLTGLPCRLAE